MTGCVQRQVGVINGARRSYYSTGRDSLRSLLKVNGINPPKSLLRTFDFDFSLVH